MMGPRRFKWSEKLVNRAAAMRSIGQSFQEIGDQLGFSGSAVRNVLQRRPKHTIAEQDQSSAWFNPDVRPFSIDKTRDAKHVTRCLRAGGFCRIEIINGQAVRVYPITELAA